MSEVYEKPLPLQDGIKIGNVVYKHVYVKSRYTGGDMVDAGLAAERLFDDPAAPGNFVVRTSPTLQGWELLKRMVQYVGEKKIPVTEDNLRTLSDRDLGMLTAVATRLSPAVLEKLVKLGEPPTNTATTS